MVDSLRVGIVGAGGAGGGHARAYSRLPGVDVVALWSRTASRARSLADQLGSDSSVYEDWRALISSGRCDVISIAAAPLLRREPFQLALEHGCHVLVEKPISVGSAEAAAMSSAADAAEVVTACCFNWRYAPAVRAAWEAIQAGQIGAVRDVRSEWYFRGGRDEFSAMPWGLDMDISDGPLGEGLSHDLDKARYLSGADVVNVVSCLNDVTLGHDHDFVVGGGRSMHLVELSGGVVAQFCMSVTAGQDRWSMLVVGDEGSLWIPDVGTRLIRQRYDDPDPVAVEIAAGDQQVTSSDLLQHTWNRLIDDFVATIREGPDGARRPILPTMSDGLHIEEVIAAIRRSSREHRWVAVGR